MRHGVGKMKFGNGDQYEGEFERNKFHGFGAYVWSTVVDEDNQVISGRRYEGNWVDGKKHGKGIYFNGLGDVYSGGFYHDLYDGKGTLKARTCDVFDGEWLRGQPNGMMKISYANGDEYHGMISSGLYEGKGKLTYKNGLGSYDGDWHIGRYNGRGIRVYADGSKFVGEFKEGKSFSRPHLFIFSYESRFVCNR